MRIPLCIAATLALLPLAGSPAFAQNVKPLNQGANAGRQGALNFTGMAQQIFLQSDRNHNSILNRYEFSTAQLLTYNTIANLGRAGLIGRGRPLNLGMGQAPAGQGQGKRRKFRFLAAGGGGAVGIQNAGMGGGGIGNVGMGNVGMLASAITNTNHVTPPQFTNYFLSSLANADASLRNMYANMRRGNHRSYARYGRGYGHRPYYGYGHPSYGYSHQQSPLAIATGNHSKTSGSSTSGNSALAGNSSTASSRTTQTGGGGPINSAALATAGEIVQSHQGQNSAAGGTFGSSTTNHSNHKNQAQSHAQSTTGNANAAAIRARITAMAQARAAARNASYSGGGNPAAVSFSGGGHPGGGGGGGHHSGGGGGGHPGGGGHAGGGGHHR